jgi:hypothetical protein
MNQTSTNLMSMNNKPIVLDLYGRKGGAAKGYQRAGFCVISVDIEDHSADNPADEFWQADALKTLQDMVTLGGIFRSSKGWVRPALVHASPPCQGQNTATASNRARGIVDDHPDLVAPTRELLDRLGLPYVIEQPTSSVRGTIRKDLTLCMDMFKGDMPPPWVQKHRSFEFGHWPDQGFGYPDLLPVQPAHPEGPVRGGGMSGFPKPAGHAGRVRGWRHGEVFEGPYVAAYGKGGGKATVVEMQHAQQMPWVDDHFSLCEAIPPAYTEYIGNAFKASRI